MRLCAVSFKECWQDQSGRWLSYGGFPLQMEALSSLFDEMTLLVVRGESRGGGMPLPEHANIVPLRRPTGRDGRRKVSVLAHIAYYAGTIAHHVGKSDIVHVPLPGDIPFLGFIVALVLRKRLLVRYGGSWMETSETTLMERVTRACMRRFAGDGAVMLATGDGESPPAPGVNWIFSTALSRSELQATSPVLERGLADPPQLIYAGRLSEEKGVANLIQALALLRKECVGPLPRVTLVGDGHERHRLETLARELGCNHLIEFVGQLDRYELSLRLKQADVCVQPSLTEGFSKAWLDAMAHGLPVLASRVGAAESVIGRAGERGWLCPPGDVAALAEHLRRLLTDSIDWPALRRRCRHYVTERTLEAWAKRIGEICAQQWKMSLVGGKLRP